MSKEIIGPESKFYTLSSGNVCTDNFRQFFSSACTNAGAKISGGPGGLKSLRSLHLGYSSLIDQDLKMIGTLCGSNLVSLDISGCGGITDAGVESLRRTCPILECLYVYEYVQASTVALT